MKNVLENRNIAPLDSMNYLSTYAGFMESTLGVGGITLITSVTMLGAPLMGLVLLPIPIYFLADGVSSIREGRAKNLTTSILERLTGIKGERSVKDIESLLRGDLNAEYERLTPNIVEVGDHYFVEGGVPGVVVRTKVTETREDGFSYRGKNISGNHQYGVF